MAAVIPAHPGVNSSLTITVMTARREPRAAGECPMTMRKPLAFTPVVAIACGLWGTVVAAAGGSAESSPSAVEARHFHPKGQEPSKYTIELQNGVRATLPFDDQRDFDEVRRGFIAALRLANQGVTINEVHNVYHSPKDSAPLYVEMMGGARPIMAKGRELYDRGQYRLAMEILNELVYAEPGNQAAKNLLADTFEQIGYQQESSSVRNSFLAAALELRSGIPGGIPPRSLGPDMIRALPTDLWLDYLAIRLDSRKAKFVGDPRPLVQLMGMLVQFPPDFEIMPGTKAAKSAATSAVDAPDPVAAD